jgi:hypothetical protein
MRLCAALLMLWTWVNLQAANDPVVTPPKKVPPTRQHSAPPRRLSLDLSGTGGSSQGQSFFEASLGLNYALTEQLTWRNALFFRLPGTLANLFGLDSSIRAHSDLALGAFGIRGIAGLGYRLATAANAMAPFAEAGVVFSIESFAFGLTGKYLFLSLHNALEPNQFLYSIVLSGSAEVF